jgi:dTDP-4-dehydrorhamnose 3,5-epimerase
MANIEGVSIKQIKKHCDDRGFICEVFKDGEGHMPVPCLQTTFTTTFPGVVKAFHWHKKQWDYWFVLGGMARIVLHDLRDGSPTRGTTQVIYAGVDNPVAVAIPPHVAHGYQVLGNKPVMLFYHTSEVYNHKEPDEERMAWDDPAIGFDWSIKNR